MRGIDVDDPTLIEIHAEMVKAKPLLRSAFQSFYEQMFAAADEAGAPTEIEIELGSGGGFIKEVRPSVVTTDVRSLATLDRYLDAQNMDFDDEVVSRFYAINVFHHLPKPRLFFKELVRVLEPGGVCVLIEPHRGMFSAWLHARLHKDEYFDFSAHEWESSMAAGPMSHANQALADIIFDRDVDIFRSEFGGSLQIDHRAYCLNGLRYLLSGGVNFKQLAPSSLSGVLACIERLMSPVARYWSLHQVTVLRKL